ncbi:E3 ubiquitin-protein ligase ubr11 [Thelohanellus kitauei]|uniref:E3 ubiquitin-protein ligase n=1 Tax=Thelohanellus kitauei TaxID=669202 RepID=A0A0C2IVE3_THEKT|nr:E3 ubiquitin-protein ligase ubr11 [Thelohanellus kitauei]
MKKVESTINTIIINGLLVTSNDIGTSVGRIYSNERLEALVGAFVEDYVFEGSSSDVKTWFDLDSGGLKMCTRIFRAGDEVYTCLDCQSNNTCMMCYHCFLHSEHVNHNFKIWISTDPCGACDCGDKSAWKCHAICTKHTKADRSERVLPECFLTKFRHVIQHLCKLLGMICMTNSSALDDYVNKLLETYLRIKGSNTTPRIYQNWKPDTKNAEIDTNANKYCLVLSDLGISDLRNHIDILKKKLKMTQEDSQAAFSDLENLGYVCVKYLSDIKECQTIKASLEKFCTQPKGRIFTYYITKVFRLYFIRLAPILIGLIYKLCFKKIQLCKLLSEMVFKKTSLASTFMLNEHVLWKDLRNEMIVRILMVAKYTEKGRIYAATLFVKNISVIYTRFMSDQTKETCGFLDVIDQIIYCPSVIVCLIENGFLCKMIDAFSQSLRKLGIKAGADVMQLYMRETTKRRAFLRVLEMKTLLCSCLRFSLKDITLSAKFKSQLTEAGKRLVQFCVDFDDMQPSQKIRDGKICKSDCDYLISLYEALLFVCSQLVKWLIFSKEITEETLRLFLVHFVMDIKRISEQTPDGQTTQKIATYCNSETDQVSLFNLSHRVFIHLLMDCYVKGTLSDEIKDKVFCDQDMLMWIGRPSITALLSINNYISLKSQKRHIHLRHLLFIYGKSNLRYLYTQDLNTIQILISHLDPELFLKYMLFNISPTIQSMKNLLKPMSSILRSKDFDVFNLRKLLFYVYNALVERHFVSVSDDPAYPLMERQTIDSLASGYQTVENDTFAYHEMFVTPFYYPALRNSIDNCIGCLSFHIDSPESGNQVLLKPEYFSATNIFYFTYLYSERSNTHKKITYLNKARGWKFQLPDFAKLKVIFDGMTNFLYSDSFSCVIMRILVEWRTKFEPCKKETVDNLIMASVILCLMLKMPLDQNDCSKLHKAIDFIFEIRTDLGGNNVMTFLALLRKKMVENVFGSVFDHLMELSQIPTDYFSDLSENPSNMTKKSRDSRDLAWMNLLEKCRKILKINKQGQNDLNHLTC